MGMASHFTQEDTSGRDYAREERLHSQNLALIEAERLDEAERLKREKVRPPKHDKLRGPYGKRK